MGSTIMLGVVILSAIASIPLWVKIVKKMTLMSAWRLALACCGLGVIPLYFVRSLPIAAVCVVLFVFAMRKVNRDGIAWWTELLRQGRRIPAVGGSDFHRDHSPVRLGNPVTAVYADSHSAADILDAVSRGRSFITDCVRGVLLEMTCADQTFGTVISGGGASHSLTVSARRMPMGSVLQIVGSGGILARLGPKGGSLRETVEVRDTGFAYLLAGHPIPGGEIWPLAISNPIYFA